MLYVVNFHKICFLSIVSISLASCASAGSTKRLNEAEKNIKAFTLTESFLDVELINATNFTSSEVKIKKDSAITQAISACKDPYEKEMEKQIYDIGQRQDISAFLALPNYAQELDKAMTTCLSGFGLKGRLAAKYQSNNYSIPEAITLMINAAKEHEEAKAIVKKEKEESATAIAGLALIAGAVALAANGSGGGYMPNSKSTNATSYSSIGSTVYGSDGTSYSRIGNTVYGSDGISYNQVGNTVYGSDGTSYSRIGNTVYGSDGISYSQIGNTMYGSDGTTCTAIGQSMYCN